MNEERWLPVPDLPFYEVSDRGRVRSLDRIVTCQRAGRAPYDVRRKGCILVGGVDWDGYRMVGLYHEGKWRRTARVSNLVLEAFVGPRPDGYECCHWDGVRDNDRLENLRWATSKENKSDQLRHGTRMRGERQHLSKLTPLLIRNLFALGRMGATTKLLARVCKIDQTTVSDIFRGRTWGHLGEEPIKRGKGTRLSRADKAAIAADRARISAEATAP